MQKVLHLTSYKLTSPRVKKDLNFFILSDVHFNPKLTTRKLSRIKSFINSKNPDYILLGGDLLDNADVVIDPAEQKRLLAWLSDLTGIAPVLYGLGNHEFYHHNPNKVSKNSPRWVPELNKPFLKNLVKIKNLHLLDNQSFEDENLAVFGLTLDAAYFAQSYVPHRSLLPDPKSEKKSELLKSLKRHQATFKALPKDKLKLILIHSPVYLKDPDVAKLLGTFDLIISGHMHNGVVPPLLDELWRSDRGFISPAKKLLTENTRRTLRTPKDKLLTVGAVTTFSRPGLRGFNAPYPVYLATLTFTPEDQPEKSHHQFQDYAQVQPQSRAQRKLSQPSNLPATPQKSQKTRLNIKRKYIVKH